jgi:hypothetical protein
MDPFEPHAPLPQEEIPEPRDDALEPDVPEDDEPYDEDFPCIRCGYNLRGLKPSGQCPECGARIRKSLNYASERILCLACMRPVHPSAAVCPNCKTPMHSAGATANYWKVAAHGVARDHKPSPPKPVKPFPWHVLAWITCAPLTAYCLLILSACLTHSPFPLALILGVGGAGVLFLVPPILLSRLHKRRLAAYRKIIEAERNPSSGNMSAAGGITDLPRQLPRPPVPPTIAWVFCAPLALVFFVLGANVALDAPGFMLAFVMIGILLLAPAIRASSTYKRRHYEYRRKISALLKEKEPPQSIAANPSPADGAAPPPADPASDAPTP